jgi:hypothetical protein
MNETHATIPLEENIVVATKNCWSWQHRWTKWRNTRAYIDLYDRLVVDQSRRCLACGKMQVRRARSFGA